MSKSHKASLGKEQEASQKNIAEVTKLQTQIEEKQRQLEQATIEKSRIQNDLKEKLIIQRHDHEAISAQQLQTIRDLREQIKMEQKKVEDIKKESETPKADDQKAKLDLELSSMTQKLAEKQQTIEELRDEVKQAIKTK